ncbi:MAG: TPM domain-containing protein [Desulfobacteraceae bacterium]|nr:TPM domain-containing protein [Desulfobacteraceae bacterium]
MRLNLSPARLRLAVLWLALAGILALTAPAWGLEPPAFHGYVNDYAHLLRPETVQLLDQALSDFDRSDSTQVAVLTIDSLAGDNLEDFSIRTAERWKIGQKGKDNGVLLLVVKNDHKLRIEVGRGLEGVLTDLLAGRIVDNVIRPLFKEGRYDEGVKAGVGAIIQACRGEFKADPRALARRAQGQGPPPALAYFLFGFLAIAFLGRMSKPLGIVAGAVLLPLAVFLGLGSLGWLALLILLPAGALGGFLLPLILANLLFGGGGGFGGFGGGGFGGGGDSGFGGFGGGDFGGGGASGGW